jgi:hypothetical protein
VSKEHLRGSAVVIRRGKRALLAIVERSSIVGVGAPGPHRYRYRVKPARLVGGVVTPIVGVVCRSEFKHAQIEAFDASAPASTGGWKV